MGKRNEIKSKLEEFESDDRCELDKILDDLGYDSTGCILDLLDCDIDSDNEEVKKILKKLTKEHPDAAQKSITETLVSTGRSIAKFSDLDWKLPMDIFTNIGDAISDYSAYGGTKTVICSNRGLTINLNGAHQSTLCMSTSVEENYKELLKRIEDYARTLDQENDDNALYCLAKLYYKATQLNHDDCNQENAIELANLFNGFLETATSIAMAGVIYGSHYYGKDF